MARRRGSPLSLLRLPPALLLLLAFGLAGLLGPVPSAHGALVPLKVIRPAILTRYTLNVETATYGAPFIQGRDCAGVLKHMSAERSCAWASSYRRLSVLLDLRGVMDSEVVPPEDDFRGSIVVTSRGGCSFQAKTLEAERAGAVGIIILNNGASEGPHPMGHEMYLAPPHIPTVMIGQTDGAMLLQYMEATPDGVVVSLCRNVNVQRYV